MSVRAYYRKPFELTLVPGASNVTLIAIDYIDEDGAVTEPFVHADYVAFFCEAGPVPNRETPVSANRLRFEVTPLVGWIPDDEIVAHPGAMLLETDPTESLMLQEQWIVNGLIDMFGVKATGQRDYIARGNFVTVFSQTRSFA